MAVRKGAQDEGKLKVIEYSRQLTHYTYDKVRGRTFPKSDKWIMAHSIWNEVSAAHTKIRRANRLHMDYATEAEERLKLEGEVIGHLDSAASLIDICHVVGVISENQVDFWTKLVTDTQRYAMAWQKSDRQRYKAIIKNQ